MRGTAALRPDPAKELPDELSRRYLGTEPPPEEPDRARLIIEIRPERVLRFSAG